jgi:hypothetical protein
VKHDYLHCSNILEYNPVLTTHQVSTGPCRLGTMYFCMTLKDLEMIDARETKYNMNDASPSSRLDWWRHSTPTITDPRIRGSDHAVCRSGSWVSAPLSTANRTFYRQPLPAFANMIEQRYEELRRKVLSSKEPLCDC